MSSFWRSYVPPCRPSRFDLSVCTDVASIIRTRGQPLSVLVLGSTAEYRDWAFEQNARTTVIDNSLEFHRAISNDRYYKNASETFVLGNWQDMVFDSEFDLVLGDLVVGNVPPEDLSTFLSAVNAALKVDGRFITKSFFLRDFTSNRALDDAFTEYERSFAPQDPFPILAYELSAHCVDRETFILSFLDMYNAVESAHRRGLVSTATLNRYKSLGWGAGEKIDFNMMPENIWHEELSNQLGLVEVRLNPDGWEKNFPVYVCSRKIRK